MTNKITNIKLLYLIFFSYLNYIKILYIFEEADCLIEIERKWKNIQLKSSIIIKGKKLNIKKIFNILLLFI